MVVGGLNVCVDVEEEESQKLSSMRETKKIFGMNSVIFFEEGIHMIK